MFSIKLTNHKNKDIHKCNPKTNCVLPAHIDIQDRIRGSVFGGAVGDALGYSVEFDGEDEILKKYGVNGIQKYSLNTQNKKALISDDTQMTLFTISALLFAMHRQNERGISGDPRHYAVFSYLGWLITQEVSYSKDTKISDNSWVGWASFLVKDIPELYHRRAPGMTCLSALAFRKKQIAKNEHISDYIQSKVNDSKGCGGIMRVAPLALSGNFWDMESLDKEGAQLAAITHSHSLGYMPAAVLTHIVNRIVYPKKEMTLKQIVEEARDKVAAIFQDDAHIKELTNIINLSISLSENNAADLENIHKIGEGWVAEETLGIAIYCSLKYKDDFSKAIIAAVNHKGDSDSTGAVTGNIMGALVGYKAIDEKWKKDLELGDFILEASDKLYEAFK